MTSDGELLGRYATTQSEDAFAELVRRHLDLVYSAALRQVNDDSHLAQDVAQTVFRDLAGKAAVLSTRETLTGWLYTSTHFAAAKAVRTERRRCAREQEACAMHDSLNAPSPEPDWERLSPVLDEAMHELKASERDVILMRYFENCPLAAIGERLGLGEDAARKRVDRALEKLRVFLSRRGVATTAALTSVLSANAVQLAPAGLAATLTTASLTGAVAGSGATLALWHLITMTKLKLGAIGVLVVAGVATPLVIQHQSQARLRDEIHSLQAQGDELARLKAENQHLSELLARMRSAATPESNQLNELLRLRSEVGLLRQQTNDLATLQAENRSLRAARGGSPGSASPESEASDPIPRDQWAFMGYATPEATAQSLLWALREGNTNAFFVYLSGLDPESRARMEEESRKRGGPTAFAELGAHETGGMAAYRIIKKIVVNDERVLLQVQAGETQPVQTFIMKKIGDEWKMAGELK
jgi:RNA polymerase sigma factor (sigma-70 family)